MTYTHEKQKIARPSDIAPIVLAILQADDVVDRDKEHFYAIGLDGACKIKYIELVTMGLVDQSHVHPRETFRRAIMDACSSIIVVHNHPSGQVEPSSEDVDVTKRLTVAGEILGISVLDHVIVTMENGYYSFAEHDQI